MRSPLLPAALVVLAASSVAQEKAASGTGKIDFEKMAPGALPDDLMLVEGEFRIAADGENKVLEMLPVPVVDGTVLIGPSMTGAATVRARIKADKARRAFPRFGIGLHGISGTKLRIVPAQKILEIVHGEEEAGQAPYEWTENAWLTVELEVKHDGGIWKAEARAWRDGENRPAMPNISSKLPSAPGQGKATVLGSPYANKPIYFDDIEPIPGKVKTEK